MKLNDSILDFARGLGDVVFPPYCVSCRAIVESGQAFRHLCARCVAQLDFVQAPHCTTCGHPFYGEMAGERMCPHCAELRPAFREGRTALLFKGPARALVIELKYRRGLHVVSDVAAIFRLSPALLDFVRGAILVPVPLHPRKQRERKFNQSALIARELAGAAGGSTRVEAVLRRVIDTESQTTFDRRTRRANLKNAFALSQNVNLAPGQHYILIDDVFTTGSTLNSCSLVLRRAGCLNLDVVTFGHG
jgi:ComF family protein